MSSAAQRVCWALARECRDDDIVVIGVATPLAAAAVLLARELLVPDLTIVAGGAVDPPTVDVATMLTDPPAICRGASAVLGQAELLTLLQRGAFTLQFVSPAQVDAEGTINTSRVRTAEGWRRLAGCLALPDTAALVGRLVAYRVEAPDRFLVERVDHVTGLGRAPVTRRRWALPGHGVTAVITERGRRDLTRGTGRWQPLDDVPPEAIDLLDRTIDPSGVIGLETRSGREAAVAALTASRTT